MASFWSIPELDAEDEGTPGVPDPRTVLVRDGEHCLGSGDVDRLRGPLHMLVGLRLLSADNPKSFLNHCNVLKGRWYVPQHLREKLRNKRDVENYVQKSLCDYVWASSWKCRVECLWSETSGIPESAPCNILVTGACSIRSLGDRRLQFLLKSGPPNSGWWHVAFWTLYKPEVNQHPRKCVIDRLSREPVVLVFDEVDAQSLVYTLREIPLSRFLENPVVPRFRFLPRAGTGFYRELRLDKRWPLFDWADTIRRALCDAATQGTMQEALGEDLY